MEIQLNCSDQLKSKIGDLIKNTHLEISSQSRIVLVERGFPQPEGCICLVFDLLDYNDVLDLLLSNEQREEFTGNTISGFSNNRYSLLSVKDIYYFEANSSRISCFTSKNEYAVKGTLLNYEESLRSRGFLRINKSQLANVMNVKEIIPWFNSRLVISMKNNVELEVSKRYSKELRNLLNL